MKCKKDKDVYLQAITMIDPATGWIEIRQVPEARADLVSNQVELAWLTRYPLTNKITLDRGEEFLAKFKIMMANDYGIKCNPSAQETPKLMQQQKGHIKPQGMSYVLSKYKP